MKKPKHYYIIDGFVECFSIAFNQKYYKYEKLDEAQVEFYLKNPKASLKEIRNARSEAE